MELYIGPGIFSSFFLVGCIPIILILFHIGYIPIILILSSVKGYLKFQAVKGGVFFNKGIIKYEGRFSVYISGHSILLYGIGFPV